MQIVTILAFCVAAVVAVPNGYGSSLSSTRLASAPIGKSSGYSSSAPVIRSSGYSPAPVVTRTLSSGYSSAPVSIKSSGYSSSVPVATRTSSSGYSSTPVALKSSGYGSTAPAVVRSEIKAAPLPVRALHVPILRYTMNDDNYGNYNMQIQTGDGISQSETGTMKDIGAPEGPVNVKQGSYSFTSPEGQFFEVRYVSDENGFQASGAHLPTPPSVPAVRVNSESVPSYGVRAEPYQPVRLTGY